MSFEAPIRTALVGCGTWGRNLLREIANSPEAELVAVVDPDEAAVSRAKSVVPDVTVVSSLGEALTSGVDAVVIASPPALHGEHALQALRAGAHVFVEKPLTTDAASADLLLRESRRLSRVAMVGHLMRYHPGIEALLSLVHEGKLGPIRHGISTRLSPRRSEGSIVWALAPHDLSLFRAVTGVPLLRAEVTRSAHDVAFMRLESETGLACHVELSRAHPVRERRFVVVGEQALAIFDDGGDRPTLSLCQRAAPFIDDRASLDAFLAQHRSELETIALRPDPPLALELAHFFMCIREGRAPRTGFDEGAEVVRVLERSLV